MNRRATAVEWLRTHWPRMLLVVFFAVMMPTVGVLYYQLGAERAKREAGAEAAYARCIESIPVFSAIQDWMDALLANEVSSTREGPELVRLVRAQAAMSMALRVPSPAECEARRDAYPGDPPRMRPG